MPRPPGKLTHFDERGEAHMVEVGEKPETARVAIAAGVITMKPATARAIAAGSARSGSAGPRSAAAGRRDVSITKGDVLGVARLAGIQGAKRTADLIPLCHPIRITGVEVELVVEEAAVRITATVKAFDRSGVEMEALAAVSAAALTVYDMCKAIDRGMTIGELCLVEKRGGKSGTWTRGSLKQGRRTAKRR